MKKLLLLPCLLFLLTGAVAQDTLQSETKYDRKTKTGTVAVQYPWGKKVVSHYLNGKAHGEQFVYGKNGTLLSRSKWKNGLQDGSFVEVSLYLDKGKEAEYRTEGQFVDGLEQGTFKTFNNGIQQSEYTMLNGKREGPAYYYNATGTVCKGVYSQGSATGIWACTDTGGTCYTRHRPGYQYDISWVKCYNKKGEKISESFHDTLTRHTDHNNRLLVKIHYENNIKIKREDYLGHYDHHDMIYSDYPVVVTTWNKKGQLLSRDTLELDEYGPGGPKLVKKEPYHFVDQPPVFKGGDSVLQAYINQHLVYPARAKEQDIQGKVYVQFAVNRDGSISDVTLVKGRDPLLDQEALRLVKAMPPWTPGRLKGKVVAAWVTMPVKFQLK